MTALLRLKIERDDDAQDPRVDHDNADIMFCKHGRYNLGDKDAEDPMEKVYIATLEYPGGKRYELESREDEDGNERDDAPAANWEDVLEMLREHADEALQALLDITEDGVPSSDAERAEANADSERCNEAVDYVRLAKLETVRRERPGIALCRPLFLYDHSGITISAGAFGCPWDSGQVGWQYMTEESIQAEWKGDHEKALRYMDATLETYDDYITGNVHGYTVERGTRTNITFDDGRDPETGIEWEHEDSCWGFYGDWWKAGDPTGMGDNFDGELKELFDSMDYNDVGEWRYVASVPEEDRDED